MDNNEESVYPLLENEDDKIDDLPEERIEPKRKHKLVESLHNAGIYPSLYLVYTGHTLHNPVFFSFVYWARCIEINYQQENVETFCENISGTEAEQVLQLDVARLHLYWRLFACIPALFVSPILGAWSDGCGGRKKPLLITMTGLFLFMVSNCICTQIYESTTIYPWILMSHFITGCTGFYVMENSAMFAMVTDGSRHKKEEGKSIILHVSLGTFLVAFGKLSGGLLASLVTSQRGHGSYFIGIFAAICIYGCALTYTIIFVKDTYTIDSEKRIPKSTNKHSCVGGLQSVTRALVHRLKEIYAMLSEKRAGWTRICLVVTVAGAFVELIADDNGLVFLFIKRSPFNWTDAAWAKYVVFVALLYALGNAFWPKIFTKLFGQKADLMMILVGLCALLAFYVTLAISSSSWMVVFGTTASFVFVMLSPGYRSFIPKLVQQSETGRVFALFGMANLLAPIISSLVFTNIYQATVEFYPGFAFVIAAILVLLVLLSMCFVYTLMVATWRESKKITSKRLVLSEL